MGCWNETDVLTNLPISHGEEVVALLLIQPNFFEHHGCHHHQYWHCGLFTFEGKYNDYGGIEDCKGAMLKPIISFLKSELQEFEKGENQYHDIEVKKKDFNEELMFKADHEGRLYLRKDPIWAANMKKFEAVVTPPVRQVKITMTRRSTLDQLLKAYVQQIYVPQPPPVDYTKPSVYRPYTFEDVKREMEEVLTVAQSDDKYSMISPGAAVMMRNRKAGKEDANRVALYIENMFNFNPMKSMLTDLLYPPKGGKVSKARLETIVEQLATWYWLDSWMRDARRMWCPQSGSGSQDQETNAQEALANVVIAGAEAFRKRWEE